MLGYQITRWSKIIRKITYSDADTDRLGGAPLKQNRALAWGRHLANLVSQNHLEPTFLGVDDVLRIALFDPPILKPF
jgi:hypothetical protein